MTAFLIALVDDPRLAMMTAGALAMIVGSATPWAHIASAAGKLTENGLDADGKITILLGAVALVLVMTYSRLRQRDLAIGAAACALATAGLAVAYQINLARASSRVLARLAQVDTAGVKASFAATAGIGVWVAIAGASLVVTAAALVLVRPRHDEVLAV